MKLKLECLNDLKCKKSYVIFLFPGAFCLHILRTVIYFLLFGTRLWAYLQELILIWHLLWSHCMASCLSVSHLNKLTRWFPGMFIIGPKIGKAIKLFNRFGTLFWIWLWLALRCNCMSIFSILTHCVSDLYQN